MRPWRPGSSFRAATVTLRGASPLPITNITVDGNGGDRIYDGAEPSVEDVKGQVSCDAGYEFSIAKQAVALNSYLKLYRLQWAAPGWVGDGTTSVFTNDDITYLIDWLGCAKEQGLTISYLGGWNESDDGSHAAWFDSLRSALNTNGYSGVQIVAADSTPGTSNPWPYTSDATLHGSTITASVGGKQVISLTQSSWTAGPAGIEAGAFTRTWPQVQYSNLSITP